MDRRGFGLISWIVVLGLVSLLLTFMTDLSHLSATKALGDQLPPTRDTIQRSLVVYGQNSQALFESIQHPGDAPGNQNLSDCLSGNCPVQNQGVGQPFSLYDSLGNGPVAGPSPWPIYYSTNGQLSPRGLAPPSPSPRYPLQAFASIDILCIPDCGSLQVQITTFIGMPNELRSGPGFGRLSASSSRSSTVMGSAIEAPASPSPSPSPLPSSSPFSTPSPTPSASASPGPSSSPSSSPSPSPSPTFFGCAIAGPMTWMSSRMNSGCGAGGQVTCVAGVGPGNVTFIPQGQCTTLYGQGDGFCPATGTIDACCTVGVSNPCNLNSTGSCPAGSSGGTVTWQNARCSAGLPQ